MDILRKVWYMFGSQGDDDDGKQTAYGRISHVTEKMRLIEKSCDN